MDIAIRAAARHGQRRLGYWCACGILKGSRFASDGGYESEHNVTLAVA
jgi:hypothetical protein